MLGITDLKVGTKIIFQDEAWTVTRYEHSKKGRQGSVVRTNLKNLKTGQAIQQTFAGNDKIEPANTTYSQAQFLYREGENYCFMDSASYEQFSLSAKRLGDQADYLKEGLEVKTLNLDGIPLNIELPPNLVLEIKETPPGIKGDTAAGGTKPATLETGKVVQVPLFINSGDKIRVDTRDGNYLERA
ncbi:elongation factor P [Candidatus Peregrinibacteria bacterium CG08_land_8_20_14_0_20_41_10]|nr:MAG: elongation factor P [Candidatus Peregrinibacteria bacterium CG1_02_41_10]PIS32080.1 MAG: elongation factor P [Candidatus Peregrinibacteria bacterium CG08_land_8_20_14_0_20_41_10]